MCEILAILAAIVFTVLSASARKAGRPAKALGATALVFWGAALMWSVDCVHSLMEGEGLLDISVDDTLLGALVVASGCALYAVMRFREGRQGAGGR